ncbi:hypothetical protein ABXJ76_17970 [Methylobacter sp. G7]|uniref:hypothetical protein n=1 Tax=Methylobacter sp. G7 TaxID=3230117 RepID=UPI003D8065E5
MIINWVAAKAQQLLPAQDTGLDECSANFDVALSVEIRRFLYTQNDDCTDAGGRAMQGAIADDCTDAGGTTPWMEEVEQRREQLPRAMQGAIADDFIKQRSGMPRAPQQAEIANVTTLAQPALDEHELALT